jgi:AraC-like DNA-binding protein
MLEDAMRRLAVPGGVGSVAARNLFSYVARQHPGDQGGEATATTRDLLSVMLHSSFGEGSMVPRSSAGLRHAVQEYLRAHATTSGIDMDRVARAHFVSRRRLYQVFEQVGASPARFLREERLRLATRMLADRRRESRTIEQVAFATGFDDPRTFARAFRRTYDCSPSEWRVAAD